MYKNPSVPDLYPITGKLSILIVSSKDFNPYITVADDVSPLIAINSFGHTYQQGGMAMSSGLV